MKVLNMVNNEDIAEKIMKRLIEEKLIFFDVFKTDKIKTKLKRVLIEELNENYGTRLIQKL